jgi:hypothetical protein
MQLKPNSFPEEQSKMRYAFNRLSRLIFGKILPHVQESGATDLGDCPAFIELLGTACVDPDRVSTMEWKLRNIE